MNGFLKKTMAKLGSGGALVREASSGVADAFRGSPAFFLRLFAALVFAAAGVALLLSGVSGADRVRRVFLFPYAAASAADASSFASPALRAEIRRLDAPAAETEAAAAFLEEYLLGSAEPGRLPPFPQSCFLKRCFVRGGKAFVDLSPSVPETTLTDPFFAARCELLKKNICTNFKNIDTIVLYFDGIEVYGEKR